jgi:DHA1 family bicyclomycin/chloramphenicol resistance-like MFS transporter
VTSKTLTVTLAGVAMVGAFAVDTFLPSFPAIAANFSLGIAAVQQALSAYLPAFSVICLFHGTLSDASGRCPVVLASFDTCRPGMFDRSQGNVRVAAERWILLAPG